MELQELSEKFSTMEKAFVGMQATMVEKMDGLSRDFERLTKRLDSHEARFITRIEFEGHKEAMNTKIDTQSDNIDTKIDNVIKDYSPFTNGAKKLIGTLLIAILLALVGLLIKVN